MYGWSDDSNTVWKNEDSVEADSMDTLWWLEVRPLSHHICIWSRDAFLEMHNTVGAFFGGSDC